MHQRLILACQGASCCADQIPINNVHGTEYSVFKIEPDFMEELKKAVSLSAKERIQHFHLPHNNQFIPTKLEVEKKEVKEPALAPRMICDDGLVQEGRHILSTRLQLGSEAGRYLQVGRPHAGIDRKWSAVGRAHTNLHLYLQSLKAWIAT
jgi:hypothetical protein